MPYIGNTIRAADDYRLIDDISSSFNGSTTSFALQVAGSAPVPFPKSPQQVLISVNGVIQEPDPSGSSGFNLVGTNIVFSSAPTNGHAFFGIIYATADYLNAGGNFPAGSLGAPSITFIGDENTGLYRKGGGSIGFVADATEIANTDSNGLTISSGNLIIPDSIIHNGDSDTKIRFGSANHFSVETAGVERLEIQTSEVVFNDTGVDCDFRVEGDNNANLIKVDAGNDRVGIGLASPSTPLHVYHATSNGVATFESGDTIVNINFKDNSTGSAQPGIGAVADDLKIITGDANRITVKSTGNVGIGIESPSLPLHVKHATSNGILMVESGDSNVGITLKDSGGEGSVRAIGNELTFNTSSSETERMRISSIGNVLVGSSSSIEVASSAEAQLQIQQASDGSRLGLSLMSIFNGSGPAAILALGHGRGSTSGVLQDNDVIGNIRFAGGDGTDCQTIGASIDCKVDGTPSGNVMPALLTFNTNSGGASATERMRIDASGRVGIGSTNMSSFYSAGNNLVVGSGSGSEGITVYTANDGQGIFAFADGTSGGAQQYAGYLLYDHTSDSLRLATTGSERMRIDSSGRVLLGTSTQFGDGNDKLMIENGTTGGRLTFGSSATFAEPIIGQMSAYWADNKKVAAISFFGGSDTTNKDDGTIRFATSSANNLTERMRIISSGNVVIGGTSATKRFHVEGPSSATDEIVAKFKGGTGNDCSAAIALVAGYSSTASDTEGHVLIKALRNGSGNLPHMTFFTNNIERVRIQNDSTVLFRGSNNNTANTEFEFLSSTTSPYVRLNHTANNAGHTFIQFRSNGSQVGEIKDDGDGTITYDTTSDYRLKENIVDITDGIERVKKLLPRRFNFKVASGYTKDGFLAHELQEVVPESVHGTKDELVTEESKANFPTLSDKEIGDPVYQTADISRVVPLLAAGLKEAIAKIETLESEVAALKAA